MKKPQHQRTLASMWNMYKKGGLTSAISSVFNTQNAQQVAFIRSVMKEQRKEAILETPLEELPVVVFDLETTGFNPRQGDEIMSIGAIGVVGHEPCDETFYSLVKLKRHIPPEVTALTGLSLDDTDKAPELLDVLQDFLHFVEKRVLIAHGSGHDKAFLNTALWRTTRTSLTHRLLDTMLIGKWLHPHLENHGLDVLLDYYGIPITNRHHALGDSRMTALLWQKYLEQIREREIDTLRDLYAHLSLG